MDLLDPSLGPLKVREHKQFGVFVDKISKVYLKSVEQAVEVMDRGLLNRTVQATKMNSGQYPPLPPFILFSNVNSYSFFPCSCNFRIASNTKV